MYTNNLRIFLFLTSNFKTFLPSKTTNTLLTWTLGYFWYSFEESYVMVFKKHYEVEVPDQKKFKIRWYVAKTESLETDCEAAQFQVPETINNYLFQLWVVWLTDYIQ